MGKIFFDEAERRDAFSRAQTLEEMADLEPVTMTQGQLKELMNAAAEEAVEQYKNQKPTLTKADIMKVKDTKERQKLIRENPQLFK